jgi:hypothetical protein
VLEESFESATKIPYRNGGQIGIPKGGAMYCTIVQPHLYFLRDTLLMRAGLLTEGMLAGHRLGGSADTGGQNSY